MYLDYINEAFKKLDLLTEDIFDATPQGVQSMSDFFDNDQESVRVIDSDATTEDDLQDSYIGKVIVNCNVCHSHIFNNKEDLEIDSEGVVNAETLCPYCGEAEGFTIVGVIAPYGDTDTKESETTETESDDTDVETVDVTTEESETLEEALTADTRMTVKPHTMRLLKLIGSPLADKYTVSEELTEDFKEVSITTEDQHMEMTSDENGKVTVTTEPVNNVTASEGSEIIAPLSDSTQDEILASATEDTPKDTEMVDDTASEDESTEDIDLDELDSESFDELGESYLKRVYENVCSFKTTDVSSDDKTMVVEGMITFASGCKKPTKFVFTPKCMNESGKLKFTGANKHLTESTSPFSLVGTIEGTKFIAESLKYNYKTSESTAVRGIVRRK